MIQKLSAPEKTQMQSLSHTDQEEQSVAEYTKQTTQKTTDAATGKPQSPQSSSELSTPTQSNTGTTVAQRSDSNVIQIDSEIKEHPESIWIKIFLARHPSWSRQQAIEWIQQQKARNGQYKDGEILLRYHGPFPYPQAQNKFYVIVEEFIYTQQSESSDSQPQPPTGRAGKPSELSFELIPSVPGGLTILLPSGEQTIDLKNVADWVRYRVEPSENGNGVSLSNLNGRNRLSLPTQVWRNTLYPIVRVQRYRNGSREIYGIGAEIPLFVGDIVSIPLFYASGLHGSDTSNQQPEGSSIRQSSPPSTVGSEPRAGTTIANPTRSTGARHQAPHTETNAIPTNSHPRAQPFTPVERFKQHLKQKAIAQLEENRTLIQQAQEKYQNPTNTEALGRLRQVVEADERLESAQNRLTNRQRTNPEFWRDETGAPVVTTKIDSEQRQALFDQNQAKLNEILQVRRTLLELYPASGLLKIGDVKETNNDAKLLATLNKRFESIFSDIDSAKKGIISEDIPLSQLEPLVAATLKETSPSDIAAVTEYLKGERNKENTFRFVGFLAQIGLTIAAIFTGGIAGAIIGAIATTMGIGQAVYEFEQADDLNTVAKTGQAGGNQFSGGDKRPQSSMCRGFGALTPAEKSLAY